MIFDSMFCPQTKEDFRKLVKNIQGGDGYYFIYTGSAIPFLTEASATVGRFDPKAGAMLDKMRDACKEINRLELELTNYFKSKAEPKP
jgi:hypothetical protein